MMSKTININLPHHLIPWSNLTKCLISCPGYICDCTDWGWSLEIQSSDIYVHFYCYEQHYICLKRFHYWICSFSLWLQYFLVQQLPSRMETVVFNLVICAVHGERKKNGIKPKYWRIINNNILSMILDHDEFNFCFWPFTVPSVYSFCK